MLSSPARGEIDEHTGKLIVGLIAIFLKMSPEERLKANDNAVRTILELRNAYNQQKSNKYRPQRDN